MPLWGTADKWGVNKSHRKCDSCDKTPEIISRKKTPQYRIFHIEWMWIFRFHEYFVKRRKADNARSNTIMKNTVTIICNKRKFVTWPEILCKGEWRAGWVVEATANKWLCVLSSDPKIRGQERPEISCYLYVNFFRLPTRLGLPSVIKSRYLDIIFDLKYDIWFFSSKVKEGARWMPLMTLGFQLSWMPLTSTNSLLYSYVVSFLTFEPCSLHNLMDLYFILREVNDISLIRFSRFNTNFIAYASAFVYHLSWLITDPKQKDFSFTAFAA